MAIVDIQVKTINLGLNKYISTVSFWSTLAEMSLHQNPLLIWTATTTRQIPPEDKKKSTFKTSVHL